MQHYIQSHFGTYGAHKPKKVRDDKCNVPTNYNKKCSECVRCIYCTRKPSFPIPDIRA